MEQARARTRTQHARNKYTDSKTTNTRCQVLSRCLHLVIFFVTGAFERLGCSTNVQKTTNTRCQVLPRCLHLVIFFVARDFERLIHTFCALRRLLPLPNSLTGGVS